MSVTAKTSPTALLASGTNYPQYSAGTAGSKFIPEIWSGKLQVKFYKATVLSEITNNDWEGEIKGQGDKVYIRAIPTITIRDYQKGQSLLNEAPASTPLELSIDKGKYFAVVVDDVDQVQADIGLMDMFTNDASEQMKIAIDGDVLNSVYADAATKNKGTTAGAISSSLNLGTTGAPLTVTKDGASSTVSVLDAILRAGQALDEQNIPETGRWIVIPAWMATQIKSSELRQAYLTGDSVTPLRNGKIGQIDRFTVYVSNNLNGVADLGSDGSSGGTGGAADTTAYHVLAGSRDAISFASQMTNVETIRSELTFGNIVRGLNVYGYKVVKPEALVDLYVTKGA